MKKLIMMMAALLTLIATGCQNEIEMPAVPTDGSEGNVHFTLSIPDAPEGTRSINWNANSALGGISNANSLFIRYTYQIFDTSDQPVSERYVYAGHKESAAAFNLNVKPGSYKFAIFAEIYSTSSDSYVTYNNEAFDTSQFPIITMFSDYDKIMSEDIDAYFATEEFTVAKGEDIKKNIILHRPFAKLRWVATDWNKGATFLPNKISVEYKDMTTKYKGINVLSKSLIEDDNPVYTYDTTIDLERKEYSNGIDAQPHNRTLFVHYIFAPYNETEATMTTHLKLTATNTINGETVEHEISTEIPLRQNWLTTLTGNTFSENAEIKVECREVFENRYFETEENKGLITPIKPNIQKDVVYITCKEELAWFSYKENIEEMRSEIFKSTGYDDQVVIRFNTPEIDLEGYQWIPIDFPCDLNYHVFIDGNVLIKNLTIDCAKTKGVLKIN